MSGALRMQVQALTVPFAHLPTFLSLCPSRYLVALEQNMPSSANLALKEVTAGSTTDAAKDGAADGGSTDKDNGALKAALGKIVRSKGFMWLAFSDKAAMYWSHAGEVAVRIADNLVCVCTEL